MANTESDATYCSEAEKENLSQRRRSKRLSEKLATSSRSNGYTTSQRFNDIHKLLKSDTLNSGWNRNDWLALQSEVNLLKKSLQGISVSTIKFVEKAINKHLQTSSVTVTPKEAPELSQIDGAPIEFVKSPNILAGMTADVFTDLPPYQPVKLPNIMRSSNLLTQANPLDLTKKSFDVEDNSIELNANKNAPKQRKVTPADLIIDLTDGIAVDDNQVNTSPAVEVVEQNAATLKNAIHTSKWLKYLPTQQQAKFDSKAPKVSTKPRSFKQSLVKLYNDRPSFVTSTNPTKRKDGHKKKVSSSIPQQTKPTSILDKTRNKERETSFIVDFHQAEISSRHSESDHVSIPSPDFLADFLRADNDSESLPSSLKENCKKILGTDCLNDLLGCEKIVYSLTARHVERLADALNLKHDSLKRTIEQILSDNSCTLFDDDGQSGSSRVECSQSPTQRLFPSQRSQTSK